MRKFVLVSLLIVVVAVGLAYAFRGRLAVALVRSELDRLVRQDLANQLPDGLHLLVCGSGSPLPDPSRAGPCLAVVAGRTIYVIDAGSGGSRNFMRSGLRIGDVRGLLLTHFHSDHIDGLGELAMQRWVGAANRQALPVLGPKGVEEVVEGFNLAYRLDAGYRNAHHGDTVAPLDGKGMVAQPFDVPKDGSGQVIVDQDGLRITAFAVEHDPVDPAVGYRFDYKGRSIVVSGDTKKAASIVRMAQNVDLLAHEALSHPLVGIIHDAASANGNAILAQVTGDILSYHTSPIEAAETARDAKVGTLLYYHVIPPMPVPGLDTIFLEGVAEVLGSKPIMSRDGMLVSLPAGSRDLKVSMRN